MRGVGHGSTRLPEAGGACYLRVPVSRMGDSLAVELPALDRAALVRIQVPQPRNLPIFINILLTYVRPGFEAGPGRGLRKHVPKSRSHRASGYLFSHAQPDMPAKIDLVGLVGGPVLKPISGRWEFVTLAKQAVTCSGHRGGTVPGPPNLPPELR
jgi:hypothetical protein